MKCGDANPKGNVALFYKGGCKKHLALKDAYRCTGCGGMFHKECILKHFELEKNDDWGRQKERVEIIGIINQVFSQGDDTNWRKLVRRVIKIIRNK